MAFRPGAQDESFLESMPNVTPAGEAPWMQGQPALTLPEAGDVRPEWNSVWIRPGMLLEPGTGFGPEGRSSAIQSMDFPHFGFSMPSFNFQMPQFGFPFFPMMGAFGYMPPSPGEQEQQPGQPEPDYLANLLLSGADLLKGFIPAGKTSTFMGPEVVNEAMENVWGFSPKDNPNFSLFGPENAPWHQDLQDRYSVAPGTKGSTFLPETYDIGLNPSLLDESPLLGGAPGPAMGFGAETPFTLSAQSQAITDPGLAAITGGGSSLYSPAGSGGPGYNLGLNTTLATGPMPSPMLSGGQATAIGAGLAAIPVGLSQLPYKWSQDTARVMQSPAVTAPTGALLAGLSANPVGLAGAAAMPFILAGLKAFDVGGKAKRTENDYEVAQTLMDNLRFATNLDQYTDPAMRRAVMSDIMLGAPHMQAQVDRLAQNQRMDPNAIEQLKQAVAAITPVLPVIQQAVNNPTPHAIAQAQKVMAPYKAPPISEGELWRRAEEARKQAEWLAMQQNQEPQEYGNQ